jgi:hypothetical protein
MKKNQWGWSEESLWTLPGIVIGASGPTGKCVLFRMPIVGRAPGRFGNSQPKPCARLAIPKIQAITWNI